MSVHRLLFVYAAVWLLPGCNQEAGTEQLCKVEPGTPIDFALPQQTAYTGERICYFSGFSESRDGPSRIGLTMIQLDATGTHYERLYIIFVAGAPQWAGSALSVIAWTPDPNSINGCEDLGTNQLAAGQAAVCLEWYTIAGDPYQVGWTEAGNTGVLAQGTVEITNLSIPFELNESGQVHVKLSGLKFGASKTTVGGEFALGMYIVEEPPFSKF